MNAVYAGYFPPDRGLREPALGYRLAAAP